MFDLALLRENIDVEDVLSSLGVDYRIKSGKMWFLCPFHNDKNIGSAYMTHKGYFVCHSCGTKADIFDVVMKISSSNFMDATIFLSNLFGGTQKYGVEESSFVKEADGYRSIRLSPRELDALQIPSDVNMKALYFYDKEIYKSTIKEKAKRMIESYNHLIEVCGNRSAPEAYRLYELLEKGISQGSYIALTAEIKSKISVCEELLQRLA